MEKPDAASAAKRSIMLPMAPMPFSRIGIRDYGVVCSSVYQIKILCDEGLFLSHFSSPDEFAPVIIILGVYYCL